MRGALFLFLTMLVSSEAFATTVIPQYLRNRRPISTGPAIGWSDRKEAALVYNFGESEEKLNGADNGETESVGLTPYVYYRTPANLNIEAAFATGEIDTKAPASATDTEEWRVMLLGLGYEVTTAPVALGVQISTLDSDDTDGATGFTDSTKMTALGLGAGYRLPSDIYLGFNLIHNKVEDAPADDDTIDTWRIGMGQVFGDRRNPASAYEVVLQYINEDSTKYLELDFEGGINSGDLQYYGAFEWERRDAKSADYSGITVKAGVDVKFSTFFVGPEFSYTTAENDAGALGTIEQNDFDLALMGGYRSERFELAAEIELSQSEEEDSSPASKEESESQTITLLGSYFF